MSIFGSGARAGRQVVLNCGDGRLGNYSGGPNYFSDWGQGNVLQFANFTTNGLYLNFAGQPHIIRCQGTCTINGPITGNGYGNAGGPALANYGDTENVSFDGGYCGRGPGGGNNGDVANVNQASAITLVTGGGGGGFATQGGAAPGALYAGQGGWPYDPIGCLYTGVFDSSCMGSGGGSGANALIKNSSGSGGWSGRGGNGGAGLIIIAQVVILNSTINVNGEAGQQGNGLSGANNVGGGGGGSGGFVLIAGNSLQFPGGGVYISAVGAGGGGSTSSPGGTGGTGASGRVYFCYTGGYSPGDIAARSTPVATVQNLTGNITLG